MISVHEAASDESQTDGRSDFYEAKAQQMKVLGERAKDPTARNQFAGLCLGYELLAARLRHIAQS